MNRSMIKKLNKEAKRRAAKGQGNRKIGKEEEAQALFFSREHEETGKE